MAAVTEDSCGETFPGSASGARPPGKRWGGGRFVLSALLAGAVLFALFKIARVSPRLVLDTVRGVPAEALVGGFLLHLLAYGLRGLRFRLLIHSRRVRFRELFDVVSVHNFMNHLLPMRTGELSYLVLANQRLGVPLGEAAGTLVIARILDATCFALTIPAAILFLRADGHPFAPVVGRWLLAAVPASVLLAALLLALALRGRPILVLFATRIGREGPRRHRWVRVLAVKVEEAVESFQRLASWRVYLGSLALSQAILLCVYGVGWVLLAGMGYPMSLPLVVLCSTLASVGFLLPVYSLGGFGTLEAGWTVGCLAAGFSKEMGLATGFGFHVIVLAYVTLLGLWGLARLRAPADRAAKS